MMNKIWQLGAFCAVLVLSANSTLAASMTVQELGVSPGKIVNISVSGFYSGGAYAGVVNLLVDGAPMDAFCIDPYHFSSGSPLVYESIPLSQGPKSPGGAMGAEKAELISKLWTLSYSPTMGASLAAGLQIAIWEVIGGADFSVLSGSDYGASALLAAAESYTGPTATLMALTGSGQDYVIANIPDTGATALLLGIATFFLVRLRNARPEGTAA